MMLHFTELYFMMFRRKRQHLLLLEFLQNEFLEFVGVVRHKSFDFDPSPRLGRSRREASLRQFELAELKHGRLAMIGMASIFSAMALPGSVPALSGIISGSA